jgi:glycosyltransferase involved in cell wall biosynthesis
MQTLFKGTAIAIKRGLPAKLLIVGKSLHTNHMKKVEEQMKREGVSKSVTWIDFVSYEEVPFYMNAIDVGTIPFDIYNPEAFYSAPNKMWEYLSQLRPVISTPIPEAINNSNYLSIDTHAEDYSLTFSKLQQHDRFLLEKTRKGYFESKRRTWVKSTACFSSILRQLLGRFEN